MNAKYIVILVLAGVCAVAGGLLYGGDNSEEALAVLLAEPTDPSAIGVVEGNLRPTAEDYIVPGHITVVAYGASWCPGCRQFKNHADQFVRMRPDVAVVHVDVGPVFRDGNPAETLNRNMRSIPHFVIFDAKGNILAEDVGRDRDGADLVYEWMNAERARNRR